MGQLSSESSFFCQTFLLSDNSLQIPLLCVHDEGIFEEVKIFWSAPTIRTDPILDPVGTTGSLRNRPLTAKQPAAARQ